MEDKVNYNIIKYLKDLANKRNDATLQTGVEYLTTALNLSLNEDNDKKFLVHDFHNLLEHAVGGGSSQKSTSSTSSTSDIDKKFDDYKKILISKNYFAGTTEGSQEYNDRLQKAKEKFYEKYKTDNPNTNTTSFGSDEDKKKKSEELKVQGNEKFKLKDYDGAIKCYSDAIQLYPTSIYYHNRGIAYSKINQNQEAINDYKKCILLDPKYIKAYDRLGLAYLQLNQVSDAIDTFNKGLEVDPTNQELQTHLSEATQQAEDDMGGVGGGQQPNLGGAGGGGMPNLGNLNFGNVQEMMQNPNFMENLGPLLQNPAVMNMTMQLMNDPNFQNMMGNMMNNPNLANLFGGMGGNPPPPGNQQ